MWFETGQTELYLGQCAEYCGTQHAKMLLRVYVEPPLEFDRWMESQKKKQKQPAKDDPRGAFFSQSCINCHRIDGTEAAGTYAPDLSHLMSRQTLASGIVPNTRDNLRQWIADPQKVKPGCLMPAFGGLSKDELDSIVDYLELLH